MIQPKSNTKKATQDYASDPTFSQFYQTTNTPSDKPNVCTKTAKYIVVLCCWRVVSVVFFQTLTERMIIGIGWRGWLSGLDGEDAWERTARPGSEAEADISWKVGYGTVEAVAECSVGMGVEIAVDAEEEVAVIIYGSCFESEIGREQPGVVVVNLLERVL